MKRLLLPFLIAFFGLFGIVKAQPTITAGNSGFRTGDEFLLGSCGIGYTFFLQPQIGPNQVWNFNQCSTTVFDTIKILRPQQVPGNINVPGANLVVYSNNPDFNNNANFRWIETDSSKTTELAYSLEYFRNNSPVIYNETGDIMYYPANYGDNIIDTVTYSFPGSNNTTCNIKELYTVEAIGYGQLITPVATYNQALQIRFTKELNNNSCQPGMNGQSQKITYSWYVPGIHLPVLQIIKNSALLGYYFASYYLRSATLGTKEEFASQLNLQTFPNPATSEVTVQFQLKTPSETQIVLSDALGKVVLRKQEKMLASGSYSRAIDVSKLPKGMYLVRLETADNVAVKKLLVQ